jgi:hypothetical protein
MKLCRFNDQRLGIVEGETIRDVSEALLVLPARHYPLPTFDTMVAAGRELATRRGEFRKPCMALRLRSRTDCRPNRLETAGVRLRPTAEHEHGPRAHLNRCHGCDSQECSDRARNWCVASSARRAAVSS